MVSRCSMFYVGRYSQLWKDRLYIFLLSRGK